jgi:hypothetical protein
MDYEESDFLDLYDIVLIVLGVSMASIGLWALWPAIAELVRRVA